MTARASAIAPQERTRQNSVHLLFSVLLAFASILVLTVGAFAADGAKMSDDEAYRLQQQNRLLIVDVRTPEEWRQTGIAEGALPIAMQDPDFVQKISTLQSRNDGKAIAFICASGNRSGQVQSALAGRGFADVYTVVGGMTGNGTQKGWIADGLPLESWSGAE